MNTETKDENREKSFNRNVFTLIFGTSLAQLITFAAYPIVSRLYTPEEFGLFGIFISAAGLVSLIATGRYELAIILPDTLQKAYQLFRISFLLNLVTSTLSLFIVFALYFMNLNYGSGYYGLHELLLFTPAVVFLTSASNILQNWVIRHKNYSLLSSSKILLSAINNGLVILLGYTAMSYYGLLTGYLVSISAQSVLLLFAYLKQRQELRFDKELTRSMALKYKDFPKSNTIHALSDLFQNQGIIYFIAMFFTSSVVGLFAFTIRLMQAPMMLVVNSFSQVFFQKSSELMQKGEPVMPALKNVVIKVAAISAVIMIILMTAGGDLFALVFSERWRESGVFAGILAPWLCADFIRYSIAQLPLVLGKVKGIMYWSVTGNVLMISTFLISGANSNNIYNVFVSLSIVMTTYVLLLIIWIFKITKHADNRQKELIA